MHRRRAIDRYLSGGLAEPAREALRAHLHACSSCRRYFDEQILLLRVLAGRPSEPTALEDARIVARAVSGVARLEKPRRPGRNWTSTLRNRPVATACVLAAAVVASAAAFRRPLRSTHRQGHIPAGVLVAGDGVSINGSPAGVGREIEAGQAVAVASHGHGVIAVVRGGAVRAFPGARLVLSQRGETVDLEAGRIWCTVDTGHGRFVVRTEAGEARVLGTSFVVDRDKSGSTDVRVISGSVEVEDAGHQRTVRVSGGQRSRLVPGAAPTPAERYSGSDRVDWEALVQGIGDSIRDAVDTLRRRLE